MRLDLVQHGRVGGQEQVVGVGFVHCFQGVFVDDHYVGGAVGGAPGYFGAGAGGEGEGGGWEGAVAEVPGGKRG